MTPYQKAGYNELSLFRVPEHLGSSGTVCYTSDKKLPYYVCYVCAIRCANDPAMEAVVKIADLQELPKDADGFYLWDGGECPVPEDWEVYAKGEDVGGGPFLAVVMPWARVTAFKPIRRPDMPASPSNEQEAGAKGTDSEFVDRKFSEFVGLKFSDSGKFCVNDRSALGVQEGYEKLAAVLQCALDQAQGGKGAERHAQGQPFHEQPMQRISQLIGSRDGMAFQAIKKIQESQRFEEPERVINELLGAINYVAGMIIYLEDEAPEGGE